MPTFPDVGTAPRRNDRVFTVSLLAAGGDQTSVQIDQIPTTVTGVELAAARDAIGNLSNAAVLKTTNSEVVEIAATRANPFDEAYASASTKLILSFQNDELELRSFAIPAPDESYFGSDGVTMITPNAGATVGTAPQTLAAAVAAIREVINGGLAGSGTFVLLNGYRSERTRKLAKPRTVRVSIEPTAGEFPGPEGGAGD